MANWSKQSTVWMTVSVPLLLGLLILINAPSIKFFTGTTILVNIVAVALIVIGGVLTWYVYRPLPDKSAVGTIGLLGISLITIVVPEYVGLRSGPPASIEAVAGFAVIITAAMIALLVSRMQLRWLLAGQAVWGSIISVAYLGGAIDLLATEMLHYNTATVPIVLGLCVILGYALYPNYSLTYSQIVGSLLVAGVSLPALLTLHGRGAYIGLVLALGTAGILTIASSSREVMTQFVIRIGAVILLGGVGVAFLLSRGIVSSLLLTRISETIQNPSEEGRVDIYLSAIELIRQQPGGWGLGMFDQLTGYPYPHNLFLHVAFAGGIIALLLFTIALLALVGAFVKEYLTAPSAPLLALAMMVTYLLFVFSISYPITDTYILFTSLCLGVKRYGLSPMRENADSIVPAIKQIFYRSLE